MKGTAIAACGALLLGGCQQSEPAAQPASNTAEQARTGPIEVAPPIPAPGTGPNGRTPLAEPENAIDPKSVEAAGQLVQRYAALIERNRSADAAACWTSKSAAQSFAAQLAPDVHVKIIKLREPEGAAGSLYATVDAVFVGHTYRKPAEIILRRVNDVPGSTEAQRRWHIERIDWVGGR